MKKSYLFTLLLALVLVFVSGCGEAKLPNIVSTADSIYQFFTDELLVVQDEIVTEVSQTSFSISEDREKINTIVNNLDIVNLEESMAVAVVQCFDLISDTNKEIMIAYDEGFLHVSGFGNSFSCNYVDENGSILEAYSLQVSKNNNRYTVDYTKTIDEQHHSCIAIVTFDRTTSNLKIDISSYLLNSGLNVQIIKNYYALGNDQKALQVEISISSYYYGARYFRTAQNCALKLSRKTSIGQNITLEELTIDNFCRPVEDVCGYVINGEPFDGISTSDNPQNTYSYFGNLSEW